MFDLEQAQKQGIADAINYEIDKRISSEKMAREAESGAIIATIDKLFQRVNELESKVDSLIATEQTTVKVHAKGSKKLKEDERHFAAYEYLNEIFSENDGESLIGMTPDELTALFLMWLNEKKSTLERNSALRRICTNAAKRKFGMRISGGYFARK